MKEIEALNKRADSCALIFSPPNHPLGTGIIKYTIIVEKAVLCPSELKYRSFKSLKTLSLTAGRRELA